MYLKALKAGSYRFYQTPGVGAENRYRIVHREADLTCGFAPVLCFWWVGFYPPLPSISRSRQSPPKFRLTAGPSSGEYGQPDQRRGLGRIGPVPQPEGILL